MAISLPLLLFAFIIFFIITREIFIKIIKSDDLKVEIHLPIFSICLINSSKKENTNYREKSPSIFWYVSFISDMASRIEDLAIGVDKVIIPLGGDEFNHSDFIRSLRYQTIIYTFIGYLKAKIPDIYIKENAITLSSDVKYFCFDITVKLRLFQLISGLISFYTQYTHRKEAKREKINVRKQNG